MSWIFPIAMRLGGLAAVYFALWMPAFAGKSGPDLRMELVSEVEAIRPGEPFTVGLHLEHGPGWHTYWTHPGIVGVPTSLDWKLPQGFVAGPIQWPAPIVVPMATVKAYGYEDEAILLVEITPPAELPKKEVKLAAKVVYMACATTCHPGFKNLSLRLPVAGVEDEKSRWDSRWRKAFEETRASFPVELEGWACEVTREEERIVLVVTPDQGSEVPNRDLSEAYFFSSDGQVNSDKPQRVRRLEGGALEFELVASFYGPEDATTFSGVMFAEAGWQAGGGAKAVLVDVPVETVVAAKP